MRRPLILALLVAFRAAPAPAEIQVTPPSSRYRSPCSVRLVHPVSELIGDLERGILRSPQDAGEVPYDRWYDPDMLAKRGAWGPRARAFEAPRLDHRSTSWIRERVLATALAFVGFPYQHHHLPWWTPPAGWPWKETCVGGNGPGIDCSNYVSLVYNLAMGLHLDSNVRRLAEQEEFPRNGSEDVLRGRRIAHPGSYGELVQQLEPGDLLFIRSRKGSISHVVIWMGRDGGDPAGLPLVLDSHGSVVHDAKAGDIPCGVYPRPFREESWYSQSASHAMRIVE